MQAFKAVTWNPYRETPINTLEPILAAQVKKGVSLFFMQEASGKDIHDLLKSYDIRAYHNGQCLVGIDHRWDAVNWGGLRLSKTPWFHDGGSKEPVYTDAVSSIICDNEGQTVEVVSYHAAPHTQGPEWPQNRQDSTVETLHRLADRAEESKCKGFLAGCDLNWDVTKGYQNAAMTNALREMRVIVPPRPTHGPRRIDVFQTTRVRDGGLLVPKGNGWVFDGGGDHKGHGQAFEWAA
jgi:hypothetical protein